MDQSKFKLPSHLSPSLYYWVLEKLIGRFNLEQSFGHKPNQLKIVILFKILIGTDLMIQFDFAYPYLVME